MSALSKLLKKAEDAANKGRWDLVIHYLKLAMEVALLDEDTEYLPSSQRK